MIPVDSTYYLETYLGIDAGDALPRLLSRASDDVRLACTAGINEDELSEQDILDVKNAVCAQTEFYVQNGDTYNESQVAGSEQIGSFQHSTGFQQRNSPAALCPRALSYLEQTGLMFRGVRVC